MAPESALVKSQCDRLARSALTLAFAACTAPAMPAAVPSVDAPAVDTTAETAQTADTLPTDTLPTDTPPTDAPPADAASAGGPDADAAAADSADAPSADETPADVTGKPDAAQADCPVAVVEIVEGNLVLPQTTLHCKGDKSYSPIGLGIKKYKWTVKQPAGSNQPFQPGANLPNPLLVAKVAGEYELCLEVWDANDVKSCVPACEKVLVMPGNGVHIDLVWDTPGNPDQGAGGPWTADLDLHFAHPKAAAPDLDCDGKPDPWFSDPFDAFWFNPTPNWGDPLAKGDDPILEDLPGAGPGSLKLQAPEGTANDPVAYSVGVHYWDDKGFGKSFATLAFFMQGALVMQFTKVTLKPLDMWYVGRLNWPNTASGGNKKVFETCWQSGPSCPAKQDLMWQPKGDWCITDCYVNQAFVAKAAGGKVPKPAWCP